MRISIVVLMYSISTLIFPLHAQPATTTLTGSVADASTGKGMPFVNVYVNGSTRGAQTNEQGYYTLTGVPLGTVEVVASFVGYESQRRTLRLTTEQGNRANFRLKPSENKLTGVTVHGNPKKWERHLKQFKKQLLGEPFAGQCLLKNPDVLSFTEEDGHLKATATEPLLIENQATGYLLTYDLLYFDGVANKVYYAGNTHFDELKPADDRQVSRFRRNRMIAYRGSTRHLMASLIDSTYNQQGFLVFQENIGVPLAKNLSGKTVLAGSVSELGRKGHLEPLRIRQLIQPGRLPFERQLVSDKPLVVFYVYASSSYSPYLDARYAYSEIRLPANQIQLTTDGTVTMPNGMEEHGALADDRVSRLLPADWEPTDRTDPALAPVAARGRLLPSDARLVRISKAFTDKFHDLAPSIFLHIDKPLYATGDRVWLSAYLLDAATNRLPMGETAMHVDLLTPTGNPVAHQWLHVVDGRATGNFRLSDTLASGTYRLRAYTDEDDAQHRPAFERAVAVYNLLRGTDVIPSDTTLHRLDVQVLPEGGRWIAGVEARCGVKIVASDGRGRSAVGRIMDDTGTEIKRFTTDATGIGSVLLAPVAGRTYYAQVTSVATKPLLVGTAPVMSPETDGLTLAVDAVSDTSRLTLTVLNANKPALDSAYLLVQQRGHVVDERKVLLQNGVAQVSLPTEPLPPGLIQVTLYDAAARPRAERLVFIATDTSPLRLLIGLNKPRYQPREKAILNLNLSEEGVPVVGAMSASITDAAQVPDDTAEADIRAYSLLTGELRGRVADPDRYFRDNTPETRRALDDLLLTQGWRRVTGTPATDLLGGVSITGRVLNPKNQPIPGAQVVVASINTEPSYVRSAGTDERGRFRLAGLIVPDTIQLLAQLTDNQLKNYPDKAARLVLEGPGAGWDVDTAAVKPDWAAVRTQLNAARIRQENDADFYRDKTVKLLKEVTVKARKFDERPDDIKRMSLHSNADATLTFDDKSPRFTNVYEMIRGRVAGVSVGQNMDGSYKVVIRGTGSLLGGNTPLYLVDGMTITDNDGTRLLAFNPNDVERIEVLKNGGTAGIYGMRGGNGVIAFYTKRFRPEKPGDLAKPGTKTIQLIGYPSVQREFYVPRYDDTQPDINAKIDRRDVLYWKPIIQTDGQGHSQMTFPISDVVRTVRIRVQGITVDGRPIVGTAVVQVQ